ncbi:MAG: flagellar filament capping protein FliD [Nitrospiria bacterium]
MGISSSGIATGLDVNSIVSQLVALEQRPIEISRQKQTAFKVKLSAYSGLRSNLSNLKSALDALKDLSSFRARSATSGDTTIVKASAGDSAVNGSYSVEVKQLAQAHKLSSVGFATSNATTVGTGTLTISVGTGNTTSVTIDSTNNTLEGIRDAINAANGDVSATVLSDGTNFRLILTAKNTGQANTIKVVVNDDDGNDTDTAGLSTLAYDPSLPVTNLTESQVAQDALLKVDGIDNITKSSNTVTDVIQGVTLELVKKAVGTTVLMTVSDDTASVKGNIQSFVDEYNTTIKELSDAQSFNLETEVAGPLLGDPIVRIIANRLQSIVRQSVLGLSGSISNLAGIGITTQKDNTLTINSTKLDAVLKSNFSDVGKIFAFAGTATDPLIEVDSTASATKAGTYGISISVAPEQATLSASLKIQTTGLAAAEALTLTVGSDSVVVSLAAGDKIADVVSKINAAFQSKAMRVTAINDNGTLKLTSTDYGSAVTITALSDTAGADNGDGTGTQTMIGTTLLTDSGVDVVGTINNHTATGLGQVLTGAAGFDEEGLKVKVGGTTTGSRGSATVSFGVADQIVTALTGHLDLNKGSIAAKEKGLQSSIDTIDDQIFRMEKRVAQFETRTREKFNRLEVLVARLQGIGTSLTQQINQLNNLSTFLAKRG